MDRLDRPIHCGTSEVSVSPHILVFGEVKIQDLLVGLGKRRSNKHAQS